MISSISRLPTTTRNGVFLDARDLQVFLSYAPSDISLTPRALKVSSELGEQMRDQFGNLRAIAGSPQLRELPPSQVDLVLALASKLETLRHDADHIANVQNHNATRTPGVAL